MDENIEYMVVERRACSQCGGDKMIANPLYREFYEFQAGWIHDHPGADAADKSDAEAHWWSARGYGVGADWPVEETVCSTCMGTGDEMRYVPLPEALKACGLFEAIGSEIAKIRVMVKQARYTDSVLANGGLVD